MRALLLLWLLGAGCTVHSTRRVEGTNLSASVGRNNRDEIRLLAGDGRATTWLPSSRLVVVGQMLCVQLTDREWAHVDAIRIAQLTDDNIAAILVGLPRDVRVMHRGGGEIELETRGRDLRGWLRSAAHEANDRGVPRYRVMAWQAWLGPFTWTQLGLQSKPMPGWPIAGTTAEIRRVDIAGSIALTAVAVPVVLLAAGFAAIVHAPLPIPGDGSAERSRPSDHGDAWRAAGALADAANRSAQLEAWPPISCTPGTI